MRSIKILTYTLAALLTLLASTPLHGQAGWDQQTACPGWNNPTSFVTGNADYYYLGYIGQRAQAVPDAVTGQTGLTNVSTSIAAGTLHSVTTSALTYDGNLPLHNQRFAIMTDPDGVDSNTGGNLHFMPSGFSSSIRIGNAAISEAVNATVLSYHMRVTPDNALLLLHHALVMQSPSHSNDANPLINIRVLTDMGGSWQMVNDTLAYFRTINQNNIIPSSDGWHTAGAGTVYYKDWDVATIDLSDLLYTYVRIEIAVAGCTWGAHWAYAYIAGECRPAQVSIEECNVGGDTLATVTAPDGLQGYRWLASDIGQAMLPGDIPPLHPLTGTLTGDGANRFAALPDDFHVTRRINALGDTVDCDSTALRQTFCCEVTTALDPSKPVTSKIFFTLQNAKTVVVIDSAAHCDGTVTLRNLSYTTSEEILALLNNTTWRFYADGDFDGTPTLTLTGDSVTADMSGMTRVGVQVFFPVPGSGCTNEQRLLIDIPQPPQIQVSGVTHVYPGTTIDINAVSNTSCSFQWSRTTGSVSGGFPAGSRLRTVPYADTAVYYIRATSLLNGCETWDSVIIHCYDTTRHKALNNLFASIDIDTINCLGNSTVVQIGHASSNDIVVADQHATLSHPGRVFLPDGRECGANGCSYRSPVTFTTFSPSATVTSANDINYVRLNIEHSFLGDLYIAITCPNGNTASLMNFSGMGSSPCTPAIPNSHRSWQAGSNTLGGTFLGDALDSEAASDYCDSTLPGNAPGTGWNYCWSNSTTAGISYAPGDALIYRSATSHSGRVDSSNVAAKTNFYHPDQSLAGLIGCPLNGTWYIEVIDGYNGDNGYIFDWELSLTAPLQDTSIIIVGSEIIGSDVMRINDSTYTITSPAGVETDTTVGYIILLFDSLGVVADTTIYIHYQAPQVTLYEATRCQGDTLWVGSTPYTETIHSIDTAFSPIGCPIYTEINFTFNPVYEHYDTARFCPGEPLLHNGKTYDATGDYTLWLHTTRDCDSTVHLNLAILDSGFFAAFEISDDGTVWSSDTILAGCRPFDLQLHNLSPLCRRAQWTTGDGGNPTGDSITYTYDTAGIFSITLAAVSTHGCLDTASMPNTVWVFELPKPEFTWAPIEPVMSHPSVSFFNETQPEAHSYQWLFSHDNGKDTSLLTAPSYTWGHDGQELVFGDYTVTLSASSAYLGPYGDTLFCADSIDHQITIVNDYLQFPNLVTPNGDGVNDTWRVVNLLECGVYSMNELWIYNHWGVLVYHVRDIKQESDFWDPEASNSPDGSYYYRFSAKSPYGLVRRNGLIEVLRH